MTDVPASMTVGDLEFNKFQEDVSGCVGVNVIGGTKDSSGKELSTALEEHFRRQETLLLNMSYDIKELLTHIRFVTGLGFDPNNEQGG